MKESEPSTSTSHAGKEFSASKGWLTGFLKRNALHNIKITEKAASADKGAEKKFPQERAKISEDGGYCADQLEHPNVQVVFLLPNKTSLIQPLDQGIIATFKKYYIKRTYQFILSKLENESLTVKDVWKQFPIFDCLINVASASAEIRPTTLNACWKKVWPACETSNTTIQTSILSDKIITLAHEIGKDGFNTFSHDDIDELLVNDALSDNDIIDLTLNVIVGLEGDNDEGKKQTPLTAKLIGQKLELCSKLENHFLINDPNSERAFKLQQELQNCMSEYRELHKKLVESSSQSLITDYIVRKERATQNENKKTVSSDDESDLEPLRKRCKPLSDSDND
ncbi:tigger transposable element-derived protein 1-like [Centruroides sculpturatus]|uniref:tigger transposable element-derived protein 1-like n=1 Tax=Centruroides sculpturatus TaxID=218467 RepID=UPI000C6E83C2|nr:tigger transposable element-derived protein 1-like [Centruroides sculpturatus]